MSVALAGRSSSSYPGLVQHVEEPDYSRSALFFVGNVIAVDEVAHGFIEMAFTVFRDCQQCRRVAFGRAGGKGNSVDGIEQR